METHPRLAITGPPGKIVVKMEREVVVVTVVGCRLFMSIVTISSICYYSLTTMYCHSLYKALMTYLTHVSVFPFSALTLLHPACKKLVVGLLVVMI